MAVNYDPDLEAALPDLELLRLRQEVAELKQKLEVAQTVLEEHGLIDAKPKPISDEEVVCLTQIGILKEASDKKLPFATEEVKNLETLVKTLLAIRGKVLPPEEKKKKKEEKANIADLLSIVQNSPKAAE